MTGRLKPETEYSLLLELAEFTVTFPPEADSVPESDFLEPTVTVPKFNVLGDTASVPPVVPVPDSATNRLESCALDNTTRLPDEAPVVIGLNDVWKVTLCPLASVTGRVMPPTEK